MRRAVFGLGGDAGRGDRRWSLAASGASVRASAGPACGRAGRRPRHVVDRDRAAACWPSAKLLSTGRAGRDGFAVLLFQDHGVHSAGRALVPLLGSGTDVAGNQRAAARHGCGRRCSRRRARSRSFWSAGGSCCGRCSGRWAGPRRAEVFTAAALLIVVAGTAVLVTAAGLSASLGAFIAGVLLSDSEYRHELEADIEPFEGLLLGFFFMSVGMGADLGLLRAQPWFVAGAVGSLIAVKFAAAFVLARIGGEDNGNAIRFGTSLAQGSEFGFVLFGAAVAAGVLTQRQTDLAMLVVGASMIATPILFALEEALVAPRFKTKKLEKPFDVVTNESEPVIICGFGRMGQVVGRLLRLQRIRWTALERDLSQVDVGRRFGFKVFYGDPTRYDLLHAAGADRAKAIVITLDDLDASLEIVETVQRFFPHLTAFDRQELLLPRKSGNPG
jgi:hypothetical protein